MDCDFPGYAPVALTQWAGDDKTITHPIVRFECQGDLEQAQYATGAYVLDAAGVVTGVGHFGGRGQRFVTAGDAMDVAIEMR